MVDFCVPRLSGFQRCKVLGTYHCPPTYITMEDLKSGDVTLRTLFVQTVSRVSMGLEFRSYDDQSEKKGSDGLCFRR